MENKYSYLTQQLANYFPSWSKARNNNQSLAQQFFNPIGLELESLINNSKIGFRGHFINTASLEEIDIIYEARLDKDFVFQYDTTDFNVPRLISPIITVTVNDGDSPFDIYVAEDNDITNFWYKAIPQRIDVTDSGLTYSDVLSATAIGASGKIDTIETIYEPGKILITVAGGTSFVDEDNNPANIKISGTNRQGAEDSEVIYFTHNTTEITNKQWKVIDSIESFNITPDTTTVALNVVGFNREYYLNEREIFVDPQKNIKQIFIEPLEVSGKSYLKYTALIANAVEDIHTGIEDRYEIERINLLDSGDTDYTGVLDVVLQPDNDRIFVLTSDTLRIYDTRSEYIDGTRLAGISEDPKTFIAIDNISEDWNTYSFRPERLSRNQAIIKYKWDLEKPDGSLITFIYNQDLRTFEEQTYVSNTNINAWNLNPYEATNPYEFQYNKLEYVFTSVGEYTFTLNTQYRDGTIDIDKKTIQFKTAPTLAEFDISNDITNPVGIGFNSDNELCILDNVNAVHKIDLHHDLAMMDIDNKIVYTRDPYYNIDVTYT